MDAVLSRAGRLAAFAPLWLVLASSVWAQGVAPTAKIPASSPFPTPAPLAIPPPADTQTDTPPAEDSPPAPRASHAKPPAPAGPPVPVRAPAAVLRVLDKVTAETLAFEAPIGRRVRYKSLVFEVKACETRGAGDAQPQPSAYLIVTSDVTGGGALPPRQVFKGWMFANYPSLHALRHPVYDAWLVACSAAAPAQ